MSRRIAKYLMITAVAMVASVAMTSCGDDIWWDAPSVPGGGFYDQNLTGKWELSQINSQQVYGQTINYLEFYGNGRGAYYEFDNRGHMQWERIAYLCYGYGNQRWNITINYEYGGSETMQYWFSAGGRDLWMTWNTDRGPMTYIYRKVSYIPY